MGNANSTGTDSEDDDGGRGKSVRSGNVTSSWRINLISERAANPELLLTYFFPTVNMYVFVHRISGEITLLAHPNSALSILDYTMKVELDNAAVDMFSYIVKKEENEPSTNGTAGSVLAGYMNDLESLKVLDNDVFVSECIMRWERVSLQTISNQVVSSSSSTTLLHLMRLLEEYKGGPVSQTVDRLIKKDMTDIPPPDECTKDDYVRKEAFSQLLAALKKMMEKSIEEANTQSRVNQIVSRLVTEPTFLHQDEDGSFKMEGDPQDHSNHVVIAIHMDDWNEMKSVLHKKTSNKKNNS